MNISKVIITKQKTIDHQYSFQNEVGLSSGDLALFSIKGEEAALSGTFYTKDSLHIGKPSPIDGYVDD